MLNRVLESKRYWRWLIVLAALLSSTAYAVAPTLAAPSATEQVAIAAEALPQAASALLQKGQALESSGRWAEALAHYEQALREQPNDRTLNERFDVARLHYSLQQRYGDRSFRQSVQSAASPTGARSVQRPAQQDRSPLLHHPAVAGARPTGRQRARHRAGRPHLPAHPRRACQQRPARPAPPRHPPVARSIYHCERPRHGGRGHGDRPSGQSACRLE